MISEKSQRQAFQLGPRANLGLACLDLKKQEFPDLTVFTADTHTSAGLARFKNKFPDDLIDVSIAEQVLISAASAFALEGVPTIATTFAPFLSMRGLEMIRHNMGYMQAPLILVGLASGVALGNLGYTHCSIEDSALLNAIPNIDIYSPAHPSLIPDILRKALLSRRPAYIRLTGAPGMQPWYLPADYDPFFLPCIVSPDPKVVIISVGHITSVVAQAINQNPILASDQISLFAASSYRLSITESVMTALENAKHIVIVEEAIEAGFYSTFIAHCQHLSTKVVDVVHPKTFLKPGSYEFMLNQAGLDVDAIVSKVTALLEVQLDSQA